MVRFQFGLTGHLWNDEHAVSLVVSHHAAVAVRLPLAQRFSADQLRPLDVQQPTVGQQRTPSRRQASSGSGRADVESCWKWSPEAWTEKPNLLLKLLDLLFPGLASHLQGRVVQLQRSQLLASGVLEEKGSNDSFSEIGTRCPFKGLIRGWWRHWSRTISSCTSHACKKFVLLVRWWDSFYLWWLPSSNVVSTSDIAWSF